MDVNMENQILVAFRLNQSMNLFTKINSRVQMYIKEGTIVAYDESTESLYYGDDALYLSFDEYLKYISVLDIKEIEYLEYLNLYQKELQKNNPNAPIIQEIDSREFVQSIDENNPEKIVTSPNGLRVRLVR